MKLECNLIIDENTSILNLVSKCIMVRSGQMLFLISSIVISIKAHMQILIGQSCFLARL